MNDNYMITKSKYRAYKVKNKLLNEKPVNSPNMIYLETPLQNYIEEGTLSVRVFTASQALPVKNAEVTVYDLLEDGQEHIHAYSITDENGIIPDIKLPVQHDPQHVFGSPKYHFTIYNIRVTAENFYPVNVLNFRIFPGEKTNYTIEMLPVIPGETIHTPEQTIIVPNSLIDEQNY